MGKLFTASLILLSASFFSSLSGCGSGDDPEVKVPASIKNPEKSKTKENDDSINRKFALNKGALREDRYKEEDLTKSNHQSQVKEAFVTVILKTNLGNITLKLNQATAPATVDNFVNYAREGFYDGTIFHQVQKNFILAAGGYTADLKEKPTKTPIRNEAHNGVKNKRGTIAMRRFAKIHSATSQFIINLADNRAMDHVSREIPEPGKPDSYGYCVFGEVVGGWEVVQKIEMLSVKPNGVFQNLPTEQVIIQSVEVL